MSTHRYLRRVLTLYITRHAKASKDDPSLRDFDRPLNDRGVRDTAFMADVFKQRGERVDHLLSSPATRALSTAIGFAEALGVIPANIARDERIYLADTGMLLRAVNGLPAAVRSAMIFGHNPGLSELTSALVDGAPLDLPTCATVRIDLPVDEWAHVSRGIGTLAWTDHPRMHGERIE